MGLAVLIFPLFVTLGIWLLQNSISTASTLTPGRFTQGKYVYEKAVTYSGDALRALDHAQAVFTALGFTNFETSNVFLTGKGPGMTSTNQPPLRGASKIRIESGNSRLSHHAELGGVRFMRNFILFFPPALVKFLALLFYGLSFNLELPNASLRIGMLLLMAAPFTILGPIMIRNIRNRTTDALDSLLEDMQAKG